MRGFTSAITWRALRAAVRLHRVFLALIQVAPPDTEGRCSLGVSVDIIGSASWPLPPSAAPRRR